eukprot:TRINITY_DN91144_c0_g1_i1.p1 TRINITY_DN91144_c0_g1~~TRINITY_DN91144_c0_g1_i1.p1  ORF type:complete len:431 (+),score=82.36 TRINITY_DN91144_c0_g1_i1:59-1351(+)
MRMAASWRRLSRLPVTSLAKPDLHALLGGQPAVLDLGAQSVVAALLAGRCEGTSSRLPCLLWRLRGVHFDLRPAGAVARSGGAFCTGEESRRCAEEWRSSDLHQALRAWSLGEEVAPSHLRQRWSRSPIATLGRPQASDAAGLSFHRHERSWLLLASGRKRWYFYTGPEMPATSLDRVSEDELLLREGPGGSFFSTHEQVPGEVVLIPDGVWHCTYNGGEELTFGVGGMGRLDSDAEAWAAQGDLEALKEVPSQWLKPIASQLARTAAEQAQLPVLRWLAAEGLGRPGVNVLTAADPATGAAALHYAAAAGAPEVVAWLLKFDDVTSDVRDSHGATPAHWAARSGSKDVLAELWKADADLQAVDKHSACTPLHLMAAEGHWAAATWLLDVAHASPAALDAQRRLPEDWAELSGHTDLAAWLRDKRFKGNS